MSQGTATMKNTILLGLSSGLLLIANATGGAASAAPPVVITGTVVPPYPAGMDSSMGACIGMASTSNSCELSVGILEDANGKPLLLWVGRLSGNDEQGHSRWLVTDQMPYPQAELANKHLFFEYSVCEVDGKGDDSVLAVVRDSKNEQLQAVGWAYRVDLTSGKFVRVDPKSVMCGNTALGAD
jgi:hypothetical protein